MTDSNDIRFYFGLNITIGIFLFSIMKDVFADNPNNYRIYILFIGILIMSLLFYEVFKSSNDKTIKTLLIAILIGYAALLFTYPNFETNGYPLIALFLTCTTMVLLTYVPKVEIHWVCVVYAILAILAILSINPIMALIINIPGAVTIILKIIYETPKR